MTQSLPSSIDSQVADPHEITEAEWQKADNEYTAFKNSAEYDIRRAQRARPSAYEQELARWPG